MIMGCRTLSTCGHAHRRTEWRFWLLAKKPAETGIEPVWRKGVKKPRYVLRGYPNRPRVAVPYPRAVPHGGTCLRFGSNGAISGGTVRS